MSRGASCPKEKKAASTDDYDYEEMSERLRRLKDDDEESFYSINSIKFEAF